MDAGEIIVFKVDPGGKVVWSSPEVVKGSTDLDVDTELLSSLVKVVAGESVGVEESETLLWSVGFWVTPVAVIPETAGLGDASPGLHGATELPVPMVWEIRDNAGTVARMAVCPVRLSLLGWGPAWG